MSKLTEYKIKYEPSKFNDKKLKKIVAKHVSGVKKHFKYNGWDIDVDFLLEDIIHDYFGETIEDKVFGEVCNIDGVKIKLQIGENMTSRIMATREDYFAVYYDSWYNEIIILENGYKVTNYLEKDGYIHLGAL